MALKAGKPFYCAWAAAPPCSGPCRRLLKLFGPARAGGAAQGGPRRPLQHRQRRRRRQRAGAGRQGQGARGALWHGRQGAGGQGSPCAGGGQGWRQARWRGRRRRRPQNLRPRRRWGGAQAHGSPRLSPCTMRRTSASKAGPFRLSQCCGVDAWRANGDIAGICMHCLACRRQGPACGCDMRQCPR